MDGILAPTERPPTSFSREAGIAADDRPARRPGALPHYESPDDGARYAEEETEELEGAAATGGARARIGLAAGLLMVGVALLVDGLQALLNLIVIGAVLATMVDIIAWLTFYLWFKMRGVSFGGRSGFRNPIAIIAIAFGIELIPFLNALPAWTAAIVVTILLEYASRGERGGFMGTAMRIARR